MFVFREGEQEYVARLVEVRPEQDGEEEEEDDDDADNNLEHKENSTSDPGIFCLSDHYRGKVTPWTTIYLIPGTHGNGLSRSINLV